MRYFHCPKVYRARKYGCGAGPFNGTQAFLDMGSKCFCGKPLRPWKKPKDPPPNLTKCQVRSEWGLYCDVPVGSGDYCSRHKYLNFSA